uniref:Uncharacterized protein n=1 Tax=Arundo donax TaxID=35708 RepID=A0A0A8Y6L9_ARUDO
MTKGSRGTSRVNLHGSILPMTSEKKN